MAETKSTPSKSKAAETVETIVENVEIELKMDTLVKVVGVVIAANVVTELGKAGIRKIRHGKRRIIKAPEADIIID